MMGRVCPTKPKASQVRAGQPQHSQSISSQCVCVGGLESLKVQQPEWFHFSFLEAIVPAHSQSLTSLILHERPGIASETLQDLLYHCPCLCI